MIEPGHIFGLLGPNGAGKSTFIKIVICDEKQTYGMVMIAGQEIKTSISSIFRLIGYCPQQDALWKEITLREHLNLYAAIRGISSIEMESVCSQLVFINNDQNWPKNQTLDGVAFLSQFEFFFVKFQANSTELSLFQIIFLFY
jgi:ABC-type multidrug transport system ATPase subunit